MMQLIALLVILAINLFFGRLYVMHPYLAFTNLSY
jgi:hypothetical protein